MFVCLWTSLFEHLNQREQKLLSIAQSVEITKQSHFPSIDWDQNSQVQCGDGSQLFQKNSLQTQLKLTLEEERINALDSNMQPSQHVLQSVLHMSQIVQYATR